jgi:hypothetical protein
MENLKPNYAKKLARLRYQDEILKLHFQKKSIRDIEQIINYKLARTNLNTKLSKSSIHSIIQKYKEK